MAAAPPPSSSLTSFGARAGNHASTPATSAQPPASSSSTRASPRQASKTSYSDSEKELVQRTIHLAPAAALDELNRHRQELGKAAVDITAVNNLRTRLKRKAKKSTSTPVARLQLPADASTESTHSQDGLDGKERLFFAHRDVLRYLPRHDVIAIDATELGQGKLTVVQALARLPTNQPYTVAFGLFEGTLDQADWEWLLQQLSSRGPQGSFDVIVAADLPSLRSALVTICPSALHLLGEGATSARRHYGLKPSGMVPLKATIKRKVNTPVTLAQEAVEWQRRCFEVERIELERQMREAPLAMPGDDVVKELVRVVGHDAIRTIRTAATDARAGLSGGGHFFLAKAGAQSCTRDLVLHLKLPQVTSAIEALRSGPAEACAWSTLGLPCMHRMAIMLHDDGNLAVKPEAVPTVWHLSTFVAGTTAPPLQEDLAHVVSLAPRRGAGEGEQPLTGRRDHEAVAQVTSAPSSQPVDGATVTEQAAAQTYPSQAASTQSEDGAHVAQDDVFFESLNDVADVEHDEPCTQHGDNITATHPDGDTTMAQDDVSVSIPTNGAPATHFEDGAPMAQDDGLPQPSGGHDVSISLTLDGAPVTHLEDGAPMAQDDGLPQPTRSSAADAPPLNAHSGSATVHRNASSQSPLVSHAASSLRSPSHFEPANLLCEPLPQDEIEATTAAPLACQEPVASAPSSPGTTSVSLPPTMASSSSPPTTASSSSPLTTAASSSPPPTASAPSPPSAEKPWPSKFCLVVYSILFERTERLSVGRDSGWDGLASQLEEYEDGAQLKAAILQTLISLGKNPPLQDWCKKFWRLLKDVLSPTSTIKRSLSFLHLWFVAQLVQRPIIMVTLSDLSTWRTYLPVNGTPKRAIGLLYDRETKQFCAAIPREHITTLPPMGFNVWMSSPRCQDMFDFYDDDCTNVAAASAGTSFTAGSRRTSRGRNKTARREAEGVGGYDSDSSLTSLGDLEDDANTLEDRSRS